MEKPLGVRDNTGAEVAQTTPAHIDAVGGSDDMTTPTSKRTTSPAFQFYPKEFLSSSKVLRMSNTEVGIYIKLLCLEWLDGTLPADLGKLAHMVGVPTKQFARLWPNVLTECFSDRGGRLTNPRLESIRRDLATYRAKQADNGLKGGRPRKPKEAVGFSGLSEHEPKKSSASASASASAEKSTHTPRARGLAPLHQSHANHAACGRVCVPADLHSRFMRSLNREDSDTALRAWYLDVDRKWSVGEHKDTPTGGDDYKFWRARFDEHWGSTPTAPKPDSRIPQWAR